MRVTHGVDKLAVIFRKARATMTKPNERDGGGGGGAEFFSPQRQEVKTGRLFLGGNDEKTKRQRRTARVKRSRGRGRETP